MLTNLHTLGFGVILIAASGYALMGLVILGTQRVPRAMPAAGAAFVAIVAAQGVLGVALALTGPGPAEAIHWVYGVAMLLVLLAGNGIAITAPARQMGATMASMAVVTALLAVRSMGTG